MTTLTERIEDQLSEAKSADVRALNMAIRKTERVLASMKRERDALISGQPAVGGGQDRPMQTARIHAIECGMIPAFDKPATDDFPEGHWDADYHGWRS